jgi:hypothetical protein
MLQALLAPARQKNSFSLQCVFANSSFRGITVLDNRLAKKQN